MIFKVSLALLASVALAFGLFLIVARQSIDEAKRTKNWTDVTATVVSCRNTTIGSRPNYPAAEVGYKWFSPKNSVWLSSSDVQGYESCADFPLNSQMSLRVNPTLDEASQSLSEKNWKRTQDLFQRSGGSVLKWIF